MRRFSSFTAATSPRVGLGITLNVCPVDQPVNKSSGPDHPDGLTAPQAERKLRQMQHEEELTPRPARGPDVPTVDNVTNSLRQRLRVRGLRPSSLESYESIQRVHMSPLLGSRPITGVDSDDVEAFSASLLKKGLASKTVRNMLGFLHQVFEHAIALKLIRDNLVRHAEKPGGKRSGTNPDIQFLSVSEPEAVLREIPDEIVIREPKPTRKGRRGPSPPPSPDVLRPALRSIILTAAMTGLRMSELRGLRWRDIDWTAQRIRVRTLRSTRARRCREVRALNEALSADDHTSSRPTRWLVSTHRLQRRPRLSVRSPADRQTIGPLEGAQALQGCLQRREGARDPPPRPATHVRHTSCSERRTATDYPRVHGSRRYQDNPNLRALRPL